MTDETPPDRPALFDAELRETLDRLGNLSLRVYDQVQEQTKAINHATTAADEARRAAKATEKQTDPETYGELVGATIDGRIANSLKRLNKAAAALLSGAERSNASFQETTTAHSSTLRLIDHLHREQHQDRRWSRWVGLGGIVLAVVLTVALPRFIGSLEEGCVVLGGTWTQTTTAVDVCVFS